MKKLITIFLSVAMLCSMLAGCSSTGGGTTSGGPSSGGASTDTPKEKQKLTFWHYHKGPEAVCYDEITARFNESQSEYEVEVFSVPDKQKYMVAMSSNDSPDIIELTNQEVNTYVANGLLQEIDTLTKEINTDLTTFSAQALEANRVDGKLYGLPWSSAVIQMFYNKDILESIGYTEPPQTMEELYEMAEKATTVDKDGNIDILGYPLFPLASARQEGIYAFGGRWWSEDGKTLTPTDPKVIESLNKNLEYRKKYDINKVQKFVATGNTNRYTPQDIFFAGKQLFRFDGAWLATQIKQNNPDVNYGVTLIPGTKANPELRGASRFETYTLAIPTAAKNKQGAMKFVDYFTDDANVGAMLIALGNLPAQKTLYEDPGVLGSNDCIPQFVEALKTENGIQYPKIAEFSKYVSLIEEHLDYVYNGNKTPEEAMAALDKQSKILK